MTHHTHIFLPLTVEPFQGTHCHRQWFFEVIKFNDNTEQTIDFEPVLHGEIYSPLRDLSVFNQVRLDPEVRTLVWPNDADFDPADLHDWHEIKEEFIKHAEKWETA